MTEDQVFLLFLLLLVAVSVYAAIVNRRREAISVKNKLEDNYGVPFVN